MSIRVFELSDLGIRVFFSFGAKKESEQSPQQRDLILSNCSHQHLGYELHIVEEGSMLMCAGNTALRVNAGELCLVSPGIVHASVVNSQVRRFCLSFELIPSGMPLAVHISQQSASVPVHLSGARKLIPVVQRLQSERHSDLLFSEELIRGLLSQIMVELARSISTSATKSPYAHSNLSDVRTFRIDDFFNNRFYCAEGEDTLAKELGLSRRQLNRVVQSIYGKSFREKLQEVRLEAARELLSGGMRIREIAERLGYSSGTNFSVFFKRATGITPTEYRRKIREDY